MFQRFAIFYTARGDLAAFGAAWLGWDSATGRAVPHPAIAGLDIAGLTATPRKYGLHGTLKAPFRLAAQSGAAALQQAVADLAQRMAPAPVGPLVLRQDDGFVALRPAGPAPALDDLARAIVTGLDPYRAPLTAPEIARRRRAKLTLRQDRQMLDWGYPFIFDDFHFHLTLTGQLPQDAAAQVATALAPVLAPMLATPLTLDAITLMGEDEAGLFHEITRYPLGG